MAKLCTDDLLDAFKELTLLELSEFVKKFEETFEVTAAAPVAVAAAPAAAAAPAEAAEEQSEFDVILEAAGEKKIGVTWSSARSSPDWASRRPRIWSTAPPSRCWRRSPRKPPRRPRASSRLPCFGHRQVVSLPHELGGARHAGRLCRVRMSARASAR